MTKKGKKRRKLEVNMPQEIQSDPGRPPKRKVSVGESVGARSDAAGSSDQCRERSLEPKHKIFLSHSGVQKDFTWQLCEDLERVQHYPFFDQHDDSLPKGERFPCLITKAAIQCRVVVLVISDEFFTRSKWPMIELNEFVNAQRSNNQDLKILPLFLGITMEQFANKKRQARWFKKWKELARVDERIDVEAWKGTLSKIPGGINAMEYNGVVEGEVTFRGKVVEAICKLLPPDVKYDVSHVQSLDHLCKPIKKKLEMVEVSSRFKVKVVGLYGMGGVGKTTISRAICNEMFGDFGGKVCHVEFGGKAKVELQRSVLRELTHANELILGNNSEKLDDLLKQRMNQHEVFLVLDNVWDDDVEEALKYLKAGHHSRSMVLVTSRSIEVLKRLGIKECSCMEMPNLEEEGAMNVLLHYSDISRRSIVDESELEIVRRCINMCRFSRRGKSIWHSNEVWTYHPLALGTYHSLALRTLGRQLDTTKIKDWDKALKSLDKFNILKEKVHPVFSILRLGYDALDEKLKEIFLDLALLWSFKWVIPDVRYTFTLEEHGIILEWEWLCTLHRVSEDDMIANVEAIQRKGLLDNVHDITKLEYNIHDLYYEFAEVEARVGPFEERRILLKKGIIGIPQELEEYPRNGFHWPKLKRLIICESAMNSLTGANLHHCKNVEVLVLAYCSNLEEVDVTGMINLNLVVVVKCEKLGKFPGLETLRNLVYFNRLSRPIEVALEFGSTKLRVVRLKNGNWLSTGNVFPLGLSKCTNLNEVDLGSIHSNGVVTDRLALIDLGTDLPTSLQKLHIHWYGALGSSPIRAMAAFTNLQDLNLSGCKGIKDLAGLCKLNALQRLDVSHGGFSELPRDLSKLTHLHYLDVSQSEVLKSIDGISHATTLRTILAYNCNELWEVPDDLSSLQHLEVLDLRNASKICRLPEDYEKLVGYPENDGKLKMKVEGCWGLIVPLVWKLRGFEILHDACEDGCNHGSSESMTSWVAAKKSVDFAAYSLLRGVIREPSPTAFDSDKHAFWKYLSIDENQVYEVLIRALCEHDICGGKTNRLAAVLEETLLIDNLFDLVEWWVVVATAPCTFNVATKGALMEPWEETLLHYTLVNILPRFLLKRNMFIGVRMVDRWAEEVDSSEEEVNSWEEEVDSSEEEVNSWEEEVDIFEEEVEEQGDESSRWFLKTWFYQAMVVVLQKCREKLDDTLEHGIFEFVRCIEGKTVVDTFLRELEAAKSEKLHDESILHVSWDTRNDYEVYGYNARYTELYPNFRFEYIMSMIHFKGEYIDGEESDDEISLS